MKEQARLEAEIAKSRMERANRRSALTGNARVDQAATSYLSRLPDRSPDQEPRLDALQRLQGATSTEPARTSSPTPSGTNSQAAKGMSLAEFMGGRATGPRLNKHAPQLDYEEHQTDYEARTRAGTRPMLQQVSNPTPVALHGLAKEEPRKVSPIPGNNRTSSTTPSVVRSDSRPISASSAVSTPFKPKDGPPITSTSPPNGAGSSFTGDKPVFLKQSPATSPPASAPIRSSTSPSPAASPPWATPSTPVSARRTSSDVPTTPKSPPLASSPRVEMLARPVQPSPSPVQRFIPATNPSPAFLKSESQKEERPSITRLQGRGFVERQVKASARLSSTPEEAAKVQRPTTAEKKATVLQRWPGEAGRKDSSPTPIASSDIPKRDYRRSLPASSPSTNIGSAPVTSLPSPGPAVGASRVAAFVAATNARARNPEHDSTPLRLPGMGGAGALPFKSRSQPDPEKGNGGPTAPLGSAPRRLPGMAIDPNTPSVLKKSSSSTDLRAPRRQRSVHFDDPEEPESHAPRVATFDGNQTDAANSKKLVHMTKDRARKPRKAPGKSGLSVESSASVAPESPAEETPVKHESSSSVSRQAMSSPAASVSVSPPSKARTEVNATTPQSVDIQAPITPVSARPSSREGRFKLPPPIVAPKPEGLRRNSIPTPTEKNSPGFQRQQQAVASPGNEVASTPSSGSQVASRAVATSPPPSDNAVSTPVSVKALASSWGKQGSSQAEATRESNQVSQRTESPKPNPVTSDANEAPEPPIIVPAVLNPPAVPMPQPRPRPLSQSSEERRRSISNRYSSIILPPLKEEKTPVATPEGSMKVQKNPAGNAPSAQSLHDSLVSASLPSQSEKPQALAVTASMGQKTNGHSPISPLDRTVVIPHEDTPLPAFSLSRLLASVPATPKLAPGAAISTETFLIAGSSSTAIKDDMHIFYDGEIIAVVHRGKNKTSGLVATTVWGWIGSSAMLTEKETTKLQDMAGRFNTSLVKVPQGKEPYDLVQLLGGTIAIRQGSRSHWSRDNTALHCVRMHGSHFVVVEEVEVASRSICSAFSYCLAILEAIFVWHGRGSLPTERSVAQDYAKSIANEGVEISELEEGEEDDLFWMMLDENGYANAGYWRFRSQLPPHMIPSPRLWTVLQSALQPIIPFCAADLTKDSILMYDGVFELFVLVGEDARDRRADIRLAIAAAEGVAAASAVTRSFPPPVHVLIFPTRIPIDLRANFRGMDKSEADEAPPPDHINLLTLEEAHQQLDQQEWTLRQLKDPQFLPLAISPAMHPDFNPPL